VDVDGELHLGGETIARLRAGVVLAVQGIQDSIPAARADSSRLRHATTDARVPRRNPDVRGPLAPNGDWVMERAGPGAATIAITRLPRSDDVTYEIVNFMDGTRSVRDIRDAVSAEFEPVELSVVSEYLDILARAGAVTFRK
jgi:hypothetical protein